MFGWRINFVGEQVFVLGCRHTLFNSVVCPVYFQKKNAYIFMMEVLHKLNETGSKSFLFSWYFNDLRGFFGVGRNVCDENFTLFTFCSARFGVV